MRGASTKFRHCNKAGLPSAESRIKHGVSRLIVTRSKLSSATSFNQFSLRIARPTSTRPKTGTTAQSIVRVSSLMPRQASDRNSTARQVTAILMQRLPAKPIQQNLKLHPLDFAQKPNFATLRSLTCINELKRLPFPIRRQLSLQFAFALDSQKLRYAICNFRKCSVPSHS